MLAMHPPEEAAGWRQRLRAGRRREDIAEAIGLIETAADQLDGLTFILPSDEDRECELTAVELRAALRRISANLDAGLELLADRDCL